MTHFFHWRFMLLFLGLSLFSPSLWAHPPSSQPSHQHSSTPPTTQPLQRPNPAPVRAVPRPPQTRKTINPSELLRYLRPGTNNTIQYAPTRRKLQRRANKRPSRYLLQLVTIGQGNWIFTYFGHNAIRVRDRVLGVDLNYNFGTFSARKPFHLIRDYLQFKMRYWLSLENPRFARHKYSRMERTIRVRTLQLNPQETLNLVRYLRKHALPKNRIYPYHHYTSNCSTKLRDGLRQAIGENFFRKAQTQHGWTYRKHIHIQMRPNPFVLLFMDFGMGPYADKPLTRWEDMFLPEHLENYLTDPLWKQERGKIIAGPKKTWYHRTKKPPIAWNVHWLVYGEAIFLMLLTFLFWNSQHYRRWLRFLFFWFAILGSILGFLMFFTQMPEPPKNANLILFHPFHWIAWWLLSKKRWPLPTTQRFFRLYYPTHLLVGATYLALKPLQWVPNQTNLHYFVYLMAIFALAYIHLLKSPTPPNR